jgi:cobalt/nickel transport system ATP-binding protein
MLNYLEAEVDTAVAAQPQAETQAGVDGAARAADRPAAVEVRGLRYSYPGGFPALRGVDLALAPREKVALVGPNGAGKSTLLLHLNGILRAVEGEVRIAGLPVSQENLGRIRALVGLVFQNPDDQLFSPTVLEDVTFGPLYMGLEESEVRRRVDDALAAVHMQGYGARMPHRLSLGERKRVAIATVLAMEPAVLALDEPSSGLDPRSRRTLIRLLQELPQAMLVATHDMHLVRDLLPRTVILDAGLVVADGPTSEILGDMHLLEEHGLEAP